MQSQLRRRLQRRRAGRRARRDAAESKRDFDIAVVFPYFWFRKGSLFAFSEKSYQAFGCEQRLFVGGKFARACVCVCVCVSV
mmetsp:Transcript_45599/g.72833  ORF Transcript_45599/g.72833 Transcript_45599/m.72833 type:complete len:82 (-) Transcript_45599:84-329(-)